MSRCAYFRPMDAGLVGRLGNCADVPSALCARGMIDSHASVESARIAGQASDRIQGALHASLC
eukprot:8268411-Alexandrium_andersonii.AAC.1